jgi:hypothetical protein
MCGLKSIMEQPRQQHYHFAYTALPSVFFAQQAAPLVLKTYPALVGFLYHLWEDLGKKLPPEEHAPVEGLKVTAHRIGGKFVALLVHMPPPERWLETYFIAVVFTPSPRYFTLGGAVRRPGEPKEFQRTTFREVSSGSNANLGPGPSPTAEAFLRHLCTAFDLPDQVEVVSAREVQELAEPVG